jgi:AcrR family transcriptional regulator
MFIATLRVALRYVQCSAYSICGIPRVDREWYVAERRDVEDGITEAALHLLRTGGPRSVTVEAVTARSGIAKTTIYRRHRDRRDMLSAALARLAHLAPPSLHADTPERLQWVITHAIEAIDGGIGFGGFASLLTDEDPEFSSLFRQILVGHRAELVTVIDACKDEGTMREDLDPETLIDAIVGTYVAERAREGRVGDDWEGRAFALFWPAVAA